MKKYQIFVSSTYRDLRLERQAAVEAILSMSHIPVGMELFTAGSKSQLEVIKKWVLASDALVLLLGGRFGSIESETGKSYTQLEYEIAIENSIPVIGIVLSDSLIEEKIKSGGTDFAEMDNQKLYKAFRSDVMSRMCKICDDLKDIKLNLITSILEIEREGSLVGWVRGDEVPDISEYKAKISLLESEIKKLRKSPIGAIASRADEVTMTIKILKSVKILHPINETGIANKVSSLYDCITLYGNSFVAGIVNSVSSSRIRNFVITKLAPELITMGLVDKSKASGAYLRFEFNSLGMSVMRELKIPTVKTTENNTV